MKPDIEPQPGQENLASRQPLSSIPGRFVNQALDLVSQEQGGARVGLTLILATSALAGAGNPDIPKFINRVGKNISQMAETGEFSTIGSLDDLVARMVKADETKRLNVPVVSTRAGVGSASIDNPPTPTPPVVQPTATPRPTSTETPRPQLEPVIYNYDSRVSTEDRTAIERGYTVGEQAFLNLFGYKMQHQVTIEVRSAAPPASESSIYADARDGRYKVVVYTESDWKEKSSLAHSQQITHELKHLLDDELSNGLTTRDEVLRGPRWLLEGVAEYVGYRALADKGFVTMDRVKECNEVQVTRSGPTASLSTFEKDFSYGSPLNLSTMAVFNLVNRAGIGSLKTYYEGLKTMSWKDSFNKAFGVTIDTFYEEFNREHASYPSHYGEAPSSCVIFP